MLVLCSGDCNTLVLSGPKTGGSSTSGKCLQARLPCWWSWCRTVLRREMVERILHHQWRGTGIQAAGQWLEGADWTVTANGHLQQKALHQRFLHSEHRL